MERDSIDFKNTDIAALFRKLLLPTVLGMIFSALFVITDGIFVGKGIGSDALAAVNIVAPLWLFSTGIGLMFGVGASVVASIHLSHGKVKAARINITQSPTYTSKFDRLWRYFYGAILEHVDHRRCFGSRLRHIAGIWYAISQ